MKRDRTGTPSSAWRLLLHLRQGDRVLEIGGDRGQRAEALREAGAEVVCLRYSSPEAVELERRGIPTLVCQPDGDLPPQVGDFQAVVAAPSGVRGCNSGRDLEKLLRELATALRPGGALIMAIANPLYRLPGLAPLAAWLGLASDESCLRERIPGHLWPFHLAMFKRALGAAGFRQIDVYAPLPNAAEPKFLVPLGNRGVMTYFFEALVPRPGSLRRRAVLPVARAAATRGVLDRLLPCYEVFATRRGSP